MGATKNWQRNIDAAIADLVASGDVLLTSQVNQPNGVAGLNAAGNLPATVVHRVGTDAEISAIDLEDGEFAYVTDLKEFRRGDGVTPGGIFCGSGGVRSVGNKNDVQFIDTDQQYSIDDSFTGLKPGGVYRLSGGAYFQSDPDSISNFKVTLTGVQGAWLSDPDDFTNNSAGVRNMITGQWHYGPSADPLGAVSMSFNQNQTLQPTQLTFPSARLNLIYVFTCRNDTSELIISHYTRVPPSTSNPIGLRRGYILERLQ